MNDLKNKTVFSLEEVVILSKYYANKLVDRKIWEDKSPILIKNVIITDLGKGKYSIDCQGYSLISPSVHLNISVNTICEELNLPFPNEVLKAQYRKE